MKSLLPFATMEGKSASSSRLIGIGFSVDLDLHSILPSSLTCLAIQVIRLLFSQQSSALLIITY